MFYAKCPINEKFEKLIFFVPLYESSYFLPFELFEPFRDDAKPCLDIELYVNVLVATETYWSLNLKPDGINFLREEVLYQLFSELPGYVDGRRIVAVLAPFKYIYKLYREMTNSNLNDTELSSMATKEKYVATMNNFNIQFKEYELDDFDAEADYLLSMEIQNPLIQN